MRATLRLTGSRGRNNVPPTCATHEQDRDQTALDCGVTGISRGARAGTVEGSASRRA
jgi:hypothetical protein